MNKMIQSYRNASTKFLEIFIIYKKFKKYPFVGNFIGNYLIL